MSNKDEKSTLQVAQERLSSLTSTVTSSLSMPSLPSIPASLIPGSSSLQFPAFDDLPRIEGQPQGCLWGFFDKDGKKDEIGSQCCRSQIPGGANNQQLLIYLHRISSHKLARRSRQVNTCSSTGHSKTCNSQDLDERSSTKPSSTWAVSDSRPLTMRFISTRRVVHNGTV